MVEMNAKILGALACGSLMIFVAPAVSGVISGIPIEAALQFIGGVIAIFSASLLLREVVREPNPTE
ncbi:hypothetical protein [Halostagnicola kamekurae]|uniref:Uncharacterized protein n=1 Tax=Halostagnicola kamekurae TaxID=619731 RepID=A0A1I6NZN6_9EURY|nr:hypothetical protein [Halostagnicola kamekurae]SFS33389.1 hypothetical protein SAMN04488556_0227 [Halostagnicola kamekurae]